MTTLNSRKFEKLWRHTNIVVFRTPTIHCPPQMSNRYFARPRASPNVGRQRHDALYLPQRSSSRKDSLLSTNDEIKPNDSSPSNDRTEVATNNAITSSSGKGTENLRAL